MTVTVTPTVTPSVDKTGGYEVKYQYRNGTIDPRLKILLLAGAACVSQMGGALMVFAKALKEYANS